MGHVYGITHQQLLFFGLLIIQIQFDFGISNISCLENERNAILQFKEGLTDTSNRLSSWVGEDCCTWRGVGCDQHTSRVIKLDLRNPTRYDYFRDYVDKNYNLNYWNNSLRGDKISPSLLTLEHLQHLDLSGNNFSGIQIPVFFGSFKYLRYLNLSTARFYGKIPDHLGNLSNLQHLDLSGRFGDLAANDLWWTTPLSSLNSLDLSGANLTGAQDWLEAISKLPSLLSLKLSNCGLDSNSPLSHANITTSIALLDLSQNFFYSTFPLWLFNLSNLVDLCLRNNLLNGTPPNMFRQFTSLTLLNLFGNNFQSSLPNSLCTLTNLVHMDLSFNEFEGELPVCLGNLTSLAVLELSGNRFQGTIPSEIGQHLGQLTTLGLDLNELEGTIPSNIWQLKKLQSLGVSYNSFTGTLSELHFVNLVELKSLRISSNFLTFNVSSQWVPPFQLQEILMDSIKLGPQFPRWLQTQQKVKILQILNTSISDTIPAWFETLYSRVYLVDLSHNQINGKLPNFKEADSSFKEHEFHRPRAIFLDYNKFHGSLQSFPPDIVSFLASDNLLGGQLLLPDCNLTCSSLTFLFVNDNYLTGNIPSHLCDFQSLEVIELSSNQLSGKIPSCLGSLQNLKILNLANNSLSDQIPGSLGNLVELNYLKLSSNKFRGRLPLSLGNLTGLLILDLGENEFEEFIPTWIGRQFRHLAVLRLQSNKFHGDIPEDLCQLSSLRILNLGHNRLTGPILTCFRNFTGMACDDNQPFFTFLNPRAISPVILNPMKGRDIKYSSNIAYLKSIALSENNLSGEIPMELMDLRGLQSLSLSKNNLHGRIPEMIGDLKQLESLDLSMNELSGHIPPSLSTIDSLAYLNLSFNNLSGWIPQGNHLQTLVIDPSIYQGNIGLCGKPLPKNCPDDESFKGNGSSIDGGVKTNEEYDVTWFYAGIGPGFAVGLLGVFCILLFKKSWRCAYFRAVENVCYEVYALISVKLPHVCKKFD